MVLPRGVPFPRPLALSSEICDMLRPSYNEVPQGFGPVSESSALGTTGLTGFNAGTIKASTVALGDVAAINR